MEQLVTQMRVLIYTVICFQCLLQITQGSIYQKYLKLFMYLLTLCICCQILTNFVDKLRNDWVGVDYASTEWMQKWNEDSTLPQEKIEQYSKWLEDRVIEDAQEEYDRREQDNEQNLEEHTTISGGGETGR
ncbi:MAG: hypothetical protein UDR93_05860 [Lachnospiraceae bacterium]|jgi:ABC-type dipeptide/oligopeptide/nickel transport system permease component|nr:hypothetical protein [Lachnospiraceae bacterium]